MKKWLLLLLVIFSVVLGYSFAEKNFFEENKKSVVDQTPKKPILRFALISDSHNENDLLAKALDQAKGMGVNFVIGLGDYTNTGTIEELTAAKRVFENSKLEYFVTCGDHDLWDSRDKGKEALTNFNQVFGKSSQIIDRENVLFVIIDNSDIYRGISEEDWEMFSESVGRWVSGSVNQKTGGSESESPNHRYTESPKLTFVFAQKTPFHPESKHVMGSENAQVAEQAQQLMQLLEEKKVDGFFSGDLHFFAQFSAKGGSTSGGKSTNDVKITTVGAVASERNFQGPRFAIVTVYEDYSWEVEDVEIR